ncbi:MAG: ribosomal protein S18-alanine N-acetyltransferase [Acidimicrobiales bacterium]
MAVRKEEPGQRRPAGPAPDLDGLVVHLVPMRRRHLRSVLRIEAQVYPRPWSISLFVSELALRSTRAYWVARVDGAVVGYCGLMITVDDGHVTTLAVDPAWHRRTIGSRLLLTLAREAVRRGATALTLEVRMSNVAAQELYRRFGFRPAGVRKKYYVETNEDALVMWADDVDTPAYQARLDEIERGLPGTAVMDDVRPQ